MKKILKSILDLWNVYGGIALSALVAWLLNYSKESIDLVVSMMVLGLTFCSVLTFFKVTVFKKKPKTMVEKAIQSQTTIKAMTSAIDPVSTGEEIGNAIIQTNDIIERTGTKVMSWIKKNVGAITSILIAVVATCEQCFDLLWNLFPANPITFNIISTVLYAAAAVVATLTSGFGSTEFKEKLAELKDQLNGDVTDLTYINDKKFLERQIKVYTAASDSVTKEISSLANSYIETINEYDSCQRLGLDVDDETLAKYREYADKNKTLEQKLTNKKSALEIYQKKLAELEAANANA